MSQYSNDVTVRDARAAYFAASGFAPDGGYSDRWVVLKAFGFTVFAFPNTSARVRAVRLHDIHHILTEYDTTWAGEGEIAAWELAAGCGRHYAAWVLNLGAAVIGLLISPRRMLRAFVRGRRSRSLYFGDFSEAMLNDRVGELRARLNLIE